MANAAAGVLVLALPSNRGMLGVVEWLKGIASGLYRMPDPQPTPTLQLWRYPNVQPSKPQLSKDDPFLLPPKDGACLRCAATIIVKLAGRWHCNSCSPDFGPLPEVPRFTRTGFRR